jgi:DNA-binding LacI/PurR family transcriptional regulator
MTAPRRRKRATIVDVAKLAEVSIGTVSHVVSGARNVRPETRERVEAAIADLSFHPDSVARAMILQRTQSIGMLVPDITNPFFAELSWSVEQELAGVDHALVLGNSGNDPALEERYLRSFVQRRVDAIIAGVADAENLALLQQIGDGVPTVLFDRVVDGAPFDSVLTDSDAGIEAVVRHLVDLGHERIALANADPALPTARARRAALTSHLAARGLELVAEGAGSFTLASGRAMGEELLALDPRPTAIVAGNDLIAMGVLAAARAAGVGVPGELSVVGYDDIAYAEQTAPPLTTVRQPIGEIATRIVELLLSGIEKPRDEPRRLVLAPELIARGSTGSP